MNLPSDYDENGLPKDPEERGSWQYQKDYARFAREVEVESRQDYRLSTALRNQEKLGFTAKFWINSPPMLEVMQFERTTFR
ncbi:hypothetical protein M0657_005942 [Pyricularia oryzae]|uniref:Uncharacterized protein n=2 Tax=Pyricularia oryzae TaxID=318829 RepID=A0AA97NRQ4_PYRO3|nr:hypothetical protein OOU_Y34scaffold00726g36 [Pyricularia oryzae Y34]KAI7921750.1 hypothetical protein M0657_005942 [Pyricularia oryzae]KAI7928830.1 hypothetical protein M9X92_001624 [Pyricularia oryzae]